MKTLHAAFAIMLLRASNAANSDASSSSPDPRALAEPAKNFGLGGLNLGGAWGNDGHDNGENWEGDGYLVDTLRHFADEGYDVNGTCAKMYPTPPECDCLFFQDGDQMSSIMDWNDLDGDSAKDQCLNGTRGWEFKTCLKTSEDVEGTRGKVTLYSPSSCTDTQDKIECVIEKFRFTPTYPSRSDIGVEASGRVYYDGNDGNSVQTHGCQVFLARSGGEDFLSFAIVGGPFEDLEQSWFYPGVTNPGVYRQFRSNDGGPLLTSGSGDLIQDMKQCGLPVTV